MFVTSHNVKAADRDQGFQNFDCPSLIFWSHLLKKSFMENFIFCAVIVAQDAFPNRKMKSMRMPQIVIIGFSFNWCTFSRQFTKRCSRVLLKNQAWTNQSFEILDLDLQL